jgi:hypothetical protein
MLLFGHGLHKSCQHILLSSCPAGAYANILTGGAILPPVPMCQAVTTHLEAGGALRPKGQQVTNQRSQRPMPPPGMKTRSSHQPVSPYTNTCNTKAMLTLAPSPPAPWTSNPTFNNTRSLLRHPLGPNSRALSLCSFLLQTRSTPWMGCILTFQRHQ